MKKLLGLIVVLLMATAVAADVTQTVNFVDANGQPIAGTTTYLQYDHHTDGSLTFKDKETVSGTSTTINYATNLPSGVDWYWTFFLKDGFLPYFMENSWGGTGTITDTVDFKKAEYCHAPIREFSAVNVEDSSKPLIINVEASLNGTVYSPFVFNPEWTDVSNFIRTEFRDQYSEHFSATTQVRIRVIDLETNTVVHTDAETLELFVDESENFQFEWEPRSNGEYKIVAESEVLDNQCDATTKYVEYDNIEEIRVFREQELADSCFASIPSGIILTPIEPVVNQEATISGTKTSNSFDRDQNPTPVDTEIEVTIWDSNNVEVFNDVELYDANEDASTVEPFEFHWIPTEAGRHTLRLEAISNSDLCENINAEEVHELAFTVNEEGKNYAPRISTIPDKRVLIDTTPQWTIDLWDFTSDETPDDQIIYTINESDTTVIDCNLDNGLITCDRANALGTNTITVTATDAQGLTTVRSFNVNVVNSNDNTDEEEEEEDYGDDLYISNLGLISGEYFFPGEEVRLNVQVKNKGNDLEDIRITAVIPELNIRRSAGPFDLDHNEGESRTMLLQLPDDAEAGEYGVRFIMRDSEHKVNRIKYRTIEII